MGRARRRREKDVEGHGATKSWAEMVVPLVVASKHLRAAYLCWFCLHFLHLFLSAFSCLYSVLLALLTYLVDQLKSY